MNLRAIAIRIAHTSTEEHTGYNPEILSIVDDVMKEAAGVSPTAKPYQEGINSAVFDNRRGNIIVFTLDKKAANVALEVEGEFDSILPEIYDVHVWKKEDPTEKWYHPYLNEDADEIFGIEMEKLRLLNDEEVIVWSMIEHQFTFGTDDPAKLDAFRERDIETEFSSLGYYANEMLRQRGDLDEEDYIKFSQVRDHMIKAMKVLADEALSLNVSHDDSHAWNVGWGDKNNLKFIDLESVNLHDMDLAPQSVR